MILHAPRLTLVATELAHLDAELHEPHRLAALLGVAVPAGWPPGQYDADAMRFFRERLAAEGPASNGWYGWYAVLRATESTPATLVAGGGYFGPPSDDTVEIGYSVVPSFRGRGLATEIIAALVDHAVATGGVARVIAHTTPDNVPSWRALERAGFRHVGPGDDEGTMRFEWMAGR